MAITWGDLRDSIRRTVLRDEDDTSWSDDVLNDCIGWALETFANHTALVSEWVLDAESNALLATPYDLDVDTRFLLPDDIYDTMQDTAQVSLTVGTSTIYADPLNLTTDIHPYVSNPKNPRFWEFPTGYLNVERPITTNGTLRVKYFAYYPVYDADDTLSIPIPRWANQAVAFLSGAYALAGYAVESAEIDRWKEKADSGNPEQNALRTQQEYMYRMYERAISKHPIQDRVNLFRNIQGYD